EIPTGIQAHRTECQFRVRPRPAARAGRQRTVPPGHLHPRGASRAPVLSVREDATMPTNRGDMTMRRLTIIALVLLAVSPLAPSAHAARKLRVVTTIPDLKSLTEAVGGDLVEVDSLTRGTQNFHEAEVKPSMMLKLRRADVLIENGVELDSW